MTYDTYITVDWSGGNQKSITPCADAIWSSVWRYGRQERPFYFRNRQLAEVWLGSTLKDELQFGRSVFVGFDFAFGFPDGFVKTVTGSEDPLSIWGWLDDHIFDTPTRNNRFEVAGLLNAKFDGIGPFWGNATGQDVEDLPRKGNDRTHKRLPEHRAVEQRTKGAFSVWQLAGAGAVGSQTLMGLPVLQRLRDRFAGQISVWPFEDRKTPVTFAEVWPSLYAKDIATQRDPHPIKDAAQVHFLTGKIASMPPEEQRELFDVPDTNEGWIFGVLP